MKEICEYCEQSVDDYLLENHKKFFHADEFEKVEENFSIVCDVCGKDFDCKFLFNLFVNIPIQFIHYSGEKKFKRHHSTHFAKLTYSCEECEKTFDSELKLSIHKKTHFEVEEEEDSNELYQCEICYEVLDNQTKYSEHMRPHFGSHRPNDCPFCPGEKSKETHIMRAHTEIYK